MKPGDFYSSTVIFSDTLFTGRRKRVLKENFCVEIIKCINK